MASRSSPQYGALYATTNSSSTLGSTAATWAALAVASTNSRGMFVSAAAHTITVKVPGDYRISFNANLLADADASNVLQFKVLKNSTGLAVLDCKGAATGAPTKVSHTGIWALEPDDVIKVTGQDIEEGAPALTVVSATLVVEGVH